MFICHASFVIYGNKNLINDYDLKERFLFSPVWELRSSFMFKCLLFCVLLSSSGSLENYVGFLYLFIFKTSYLSHSHGILGSMLLVLLSSLPQVRLEGCESMGRALSFSLPMSLMADGTAHKSNGFNVVPLAYPLKS